MFWRSHLSPKGKMGQLLSLSAPALVSSQMNGFGDPAAQLQPKGALLGVLHRSYKYSTHGAYS